MASINISPCVPPCDGQIAWNQAHDRLQNFLNAFALGDHAQVSRLTLKLLDQARELHRQDPSRDPTSLVMEQTQKKLAEWLGMNLNGETRAPQQIYASGYIAMFLSEPFRAMPDSFLDSPLPEELRQSMRQVLVVTGPDLDVSSMTSRDIDYGPMLDLANNTWHQWSTRSVLLAMLFWTVVYLCSYFLISYFL